MSTSPARKRVKSANFPIDLTSYNEVAIDPWATQSLSAEQKAALTHNIGLIRDTIVFFTSCGGIRGYGGHTGGPFDTVPEVMILDAFFRGRPDKFVPIFFDEAGHRVATQYVMAVLEGELEAEKLTNYRVGHAHLPGHPELGHTPGVKFSSGRLGHMWPFVNGIAMANPGKICICLGSDGAEQEGNDAEAARLAVAQNLPVKLIIDDNNVTIAGHPSEYLKGFEVGKTLEGHGINTVIRANGEDIDEVFAGLKKIMLADGPAALILKRAMCPGIKGLEGSCHGHDVINASAAIGYLESRGRQDCVDFLKALKKPSEGYEYIGSGEWGVCRSAFGKAVNLCLAKMTLEERKARVKVIDTDLKGSVGLQAIETAYPEVFIPSGIMERGNFSAAAGFGFEKGKQGIFSTFGAFQEMILSELTMARLNHAAVLCHFSHTGMDDMADNTCHFGLNMLFADNGLDDDHVPTYLIAPADERQMIKVVEKIFHVHALRFVYSTRSKTKAILKEDGTPLYGDDYEFEVGKDEVVRTGTKGYIVSYGDALYRCVDAVERLKKEGIDVGLINKPSLNVPDDATLAKLGAAPFVLVVEAYSRRTGLGSRFGTWLLERGHHPKYAHLGTWREGSGGLWEHYAHQGLDPKSVMEKVKTMI